MFVTNPSSIFRLWQKQEYFTEDRKGAIFNKLAKLLQTNYVNSYFQ